MPRYAVLGEDRSDVETLTVLIRRLCGDDRVPVQSKGYDGCGGLMRKGARDLAELFRLGCERFVIAHDADRTDPQVRHDSVRSRIVAPSNVPPQICCIVVPIEELEAWLLADIAAVTKKWPDWRPTPITHPERIRDPKEHLEKLSRDSQRRPRYSHKVDNPRLAAAIDLAVVERKCPSFAPLAAFVRGENSGRR